MQHTYFSHGGSSFDAVLGALIAGMAIFYWGRVFREGVLFSGETNPPLLTMIIMCGVSMIVASAILFYDVFSNLPPRKFFQELDRACCHRAKNDLLTLGLLESMRREQLIKESNEAFKYLIS